MCTSFYSRPSGGFTLLAIGSIQIPRKLEVAFCFHQGFSMEYRQSEFEPFLCSGTGARIRFPTFAEDFRVIG